MKKVLVLMATYNGERFLREQVESVLNQTGVDVSLVFSDDSSTDSTCDVIKHYLDLPNVYFIQNVPGSGSAAKNFLGMVRQSEKFGNYDYYSFADQDDIWLPNKLEEAVNKCEETQSDFYFSNLIRWDFLENKKTIIKKSFPGKKFDFLFEGGSAGCTYVFSSSFCKAIKSHIETIDVSGWKSFSHDWYFYFFARINNFRIYSDANAYILYRIHDTNVHGQMNSFSVGAVLKRISLLREGWYFEHIEGFIKMLPENSREFKIYSLYTKNFLSRAYVVLRHNFELMRSRRKYLMFAAASLVVKNRHN